MQASSKGNNKNEMCNWEGKKKNNQIKKLKNKLLESGF